MSIESNSGSAAISHFSMSGRGGHTAGNAWTTFRLSVGTAAPEAACVRSIDDRRKYEYRGVERRNSLTHNDVFNSKKSSGTYVTTPIVPLRPVVPPGP